jgi:Putative MetA-pathway of phenol degradation
MPISIPNKSITFIAALLGSYPIFANSSEPADNHRIEIQQLRAVNQQQNQALQIMEQRLRQLEQKLAASSRPSSRQTAASKLQRSNQHSNQNENRDRLRDPRPSKSVENLLQEEHALFDNNLSMEVGFTYAHANRSELILNGFLALDAIFLGDLSVDEVESDIWTTNYTFRYGFNDRLQVDIDIPYLSRETKYLSRGVDFDSTARFEQSVSDKGLGDISVGMSYRLWHETFERPDIVLNMRVKAPTGEDPYGIDIVEVEGAGGNLSIPNALPTGNGVWSLQTGLSFLKTSDPAILFGNIDYLYNFKESFDDMDGNPTTETAGEIQMGNAWQFGMGIAFALNEKMSMSLSYSQRFVEASEQRIGDNSWREIVGSEASSGTFSTGVTYALSDKLAVVTNLGIGLTNDASDYTFGIKIPYRF